MLGEEEEVVSDGKIILTPKENLAVGFGQDITRVSAISVLGRWR